MRSKIVCGAIAALGTVIVASAPTWAQEIAEVRFGTNAPLKVVAPKGMSGGAYQSMLFDAYNKIISGNAPLGRYISPADVVILCPPASTTVLSGKRPTTSTVAGKGGRSATPIPAEGKLSPTGTYLIYVLGRRFLTVTPAMAKANGATSSAALATKLARQYMQKLPRECFRPPTLPALTSVPANPRLQLTTNIENCIPADVNGRVVMFGKGLFNVAPVQPDGSTGPDKAAQLTAKTSRVTGSMASFTPGSVVAAKNGKAAADVKIGTTTLYTVSDFDARSNGFKNAFGFAQYLAPLVDKRLEAQFPATVAPEAPVSETPAPETPAPAPDAPAPATP